jgi:hypothetical protein
MSFIHRVRNLRVDEDIVVSFNSWGGFLRGMVERRLGLWIEGEWRIVAVAVAVGRGGYGRCFLNRRIE